MFDYFIVLAVIYAVYKIVDGFVLGELLPGAVRLYREYRELRHPGHPNLGTFEDNDDLEIRYRP